MIEVPGNIYDTPDNWRTVTNSRKKFRESVLVEPDFKSRIKKETTAFIRGRDRALRAISTLKLGQAIIVNPAKWTRRNELEKGKMFKGTWESSIRSDISKLKGVIDANFTTVVIHTARGPVLAVARIAKKVIGC